MTLEDGFTNLEFADITPQEHSLEELERMLFDERRIYQAYQQHDPHGLDPDIDCARRDVGKLIKELQNLISKRTIMNPHVSFPAAQIDSALLLRQKNELVSLRAKYPENSDTFELFSGIIHLMDFIGDHLLEAIKDQLVCITDYDNWTSRFILDAEKCPKEYREIYQTVLQCNDYIKMGCMDAIPADLFQETHWEQFRHFGLNQEFEAE